MKKIKFLALLIIFFINSPAQDTWTQKANFGGMARYGATGISIGNYGYVGLGIGDAGYNSDFWQYDPLTNTWTQKADFAGGARVGATGFSYAGKGYIGMGAKTSGDFDWLWYKDIWQYDPLSNNWIRKNDFGGQERYLAVSFTIGDKVYSGAGNYRKNRSEIAHYLNDFWEYDPITDLWMQKANVPEEGRSSAVGMSIGNKGYIGTGFYYYDTRKNDFWQYDPPTDAWTRKADMPGTGRYGASAFSIGNKGFISSGYYYSGYNDLWEYNPSTDQWIQRADLPGSDRNQGISFTIGHKGYVGLGQSSVESISDFWQYDPYAVTLKCPDNKTVSSGIGATNAVVGGIDPVITVNPPDFTPSLNYTLIRNGELVGCGTGSASGQTFALGTTLVTYSLTEYPNQTCSFNVTVLGEIPSCNISSVPTSHVFTDGNPNHIFLGYGPQTTKLEVTVPVSGAPYTYKWIGYTTGLSSTTSKKPLYTPTATGSYTFTVEATNKYGYKTTCSITICVLDIREYKANGNPTGKVYVCHSPAGNHGNAHTLSINVYAVAAHLRYHSGDHLGKCNDVICEAQTVTSRNEQVGEGAKAENVENIETEDELVINVSPNPSVDEFRIQVYSNSNEPVVVRVMDAGGMILTTTSKIAKSSVITIGSGLTNGIYFAEVTQGKQKKMIKLIKAN